MSFELELYYRDVANSQFVAIDNIQTYSGLNWHRSLSGIGFATFNLNPYDFKALSPNIIPARTVVAIKENNTIRWVGEITRPLDYSVSGVGGSVNVGVIGYFGTLLSRTTRYIQPTNGVNVDNQAVLFSQVDAGTIAWDLINSSQNLTNGYLGFTEGEIVASTSKNRTYYDKKIAEAISLLSNVNNGIDFYLGYAQDANNRLSSVVFNAGAVIGRRREDLPKVIPGENCNTASFSLQNDLYNTVTGIGIGSGDSVLSSLKESSGSQIGFSRKEITLGAKDISDPSYLSEVTEKALNESTSNKWHVELELTPYDSNEKVGFRGTDINLGDYLYLDLTTDPQSILNFQGWARVLETSHRIDSTGVEFISSKFEVYL
jgi:hypothetical protein